MLGSLVFPFFEYTYTVEVIFPVIEASNTFFNTEGKIQEQVISFWSWKNILLIGYGLVALILCIRNIIGIHRLKSLLNRGELKINNHRKVINIPSYPHSFTFLNKIILGDLDNRTIVEKELIIEHENAHVSQKHWIDLNLVQGLCVLQWFNPFAWLFCKAVRENQEYLADEEVLKKGISPVIYQAALINSMLNHTVFNLTSSFTSNKFKRIKMMKKNSSKPIKKFSVLLLIPALCLFLWAFAEPEYKMVQENSDLSQRKDNKVSLDSIMTNNDDHKNNENRKQVVFVSYKKDSNETVVEEYVVENVDKKYIGKADGNIDKQTQERISEILKEGEIFCVVDEKEFLFKSVEELNKEMAKRDNSVLTISILKDNVAVDRYGDKGKNGVIIIKTTKKNTNGSDDFDFSKALFIVNGKEISSKSIVKDSSYSYLFLSGKDAIAKYGEKGKNGVILMSTKE